MEAMGADVSQKIRSAIKAKLIELKAYVDDELPDYIMVMVANKKTKMQMDDDLFLFLGNNTKIFTNWLNQVLERLQSVTADVSMKKKALVHAKSEVETVTKLPKQGQSAEEMMSNTVEGREPVEADEIDVQDEVLAIKAELDPDDLLTEELEGNDEVIGDTLVKGSRRQHVSAPIPRVTSVMKAHSTSISKNGQQSPRGIKRSSTMTAVPRKRKAPSSMVGAIVTRDTEDDDEEIPTGALASVVKVSERRSSIPPGMQANKNLIMKAVAEAKKSVLEAARKKSSINLRRDDAPVMQSNRKLFTRKHRAAAMQDYFGTVNTTDVSPLVPEDYEEENGEMAETPEAIARSASEMALLRMIQRERGVDENFSLEDEESRRRSVQDNDEEMRVTSPRFIVTLDGIDVDSFTKKHTFSPLGVRSMDLDEEDDDDDEDFIMTQDCDDDFQELANDPEPEKVPADSTSKNSEKCKYWPKCKNGYHCLYHHPNKPCKTFPNCRFGEKCLYIHPNCKYGANCTKSDCPYFHDKRMPPSANPVSRPPVPQREIKCKFFPNCSNMNCKFYHPKPCRYGLSCTQSGCTFYHPPLPSRDKLKWSSSVAAGETTKN